MNILVPTDFSRNAEAALIYAVNLLKYIGGTIRLLHVITPYVSRTTYLKIESDELVDSTTNRLLILRDSLMADSGIECSCTAVPGDVIEKILEVSREKDIDMIIMGSNKRRYFLFGNITTSIVEHSMIPVMVLPRGMEFTPYSKIVFATDYQPNDLQDLQRLSRIAKPFDCELNVVHIVNRFEDDDDQIDQTMIDAFSDLIEKHVPYTKIKCEEYQFVDVPDGIQSYAEEEQADLLVVSTRQRKFIQRLFGRSVTRELLFDFNHPMLVFHSFEKTSEKPLTVDEVNYNLKLI
jgi:nucleotide-binding universal stress UspA family protein